MEAATPWRHPNTPAKMIRLSVICRRAVGPRFLLNNITGWDSEFRICDSSLACHDCVPHHRHRENIRKSLMRMKILINEAMYKVLSCSITPAFSSWCITARHTKPAQVLQRSEFPVPPP